MPTIHPTAMVSPRAELAEGVVIGPLVTVEDGVSISRDTRVGTGSYIATGTTIGESNVIHMYAVIGNLPQDWHYDGGETYTIIGSRNVIREFVTIHRGTQAGSATRIGDGNSLMATSHVAHNCTVGDNASLANGVLMGGHSEVGSRCFISGHAMIHQFARVGRLAMVSGGARVSRDAPPFSMCMGDSAIHGLNRVGMRRAGMSAEAMSAVGRAYRRLFMSGEAPDKAAAKILADEPSQEAREMAEFVLSSRRGLCTHVRKRRGSRESD